MSPHYQTEIFDVREVILTGTAGRVFWQERLRAEGLVPFPANGSAELMISATTSKYRGIRFKEMIIAISVCEQEGADEPDGFFLIHAFNSLRLFALVERRLFRTPYYPAAIEVQEQLPAAIRLSIDGRPAFSATMSGVHERQSSGGELWEGVIYLPRRMAGKGSAGEHFFARLGGDTDVYPFSPISDRLDFRPGPGDAALGWLVESNFAPTEWRLRSHAAHARSRTYDRLT